MKYEPVEYISESQAEERLSIGDPSAIAEVLVASALHVQNVSKVEEWICHYSTHRDPGVRRASALALGHLARIHGAVGDSSLAAVRKLTADADVSGAAHDALEDVDISTRGQWL